MAITYTVKKGDTLNSIVQAQGFKNYKEAGITSVPSGNFDLIRPGEVITIGNAKPTTGTGLNTTGTKPPPPPITSSNIDSAINGNQNQDFADASAGNEPPVRNSTKTYNDIYNQITTSLKNGLPEKPENTSMVETYKTMLADKGVTDLENQLNALQAQARDIQANSIARTNAEKGKAVSMNVISGRVSEAQQQENEKLLAVNNSIKTITDQLTVKYNTIESMMKYTGQDYANSVDAYNTQFTQNMSVMNMVKGMVDEQKSDEEKVADNARANLQIIYNNMPAGGITDTAQKANITKLELQAGLPTGFYENITSKNPKADVLSTTTRESGGIKYADVIMKNTDGSITTKTVTLGSSSGGSSTETHEEKKSKAFAMINKLLELKDEEGVPYIEESTGYFTAKGFKTLVKNAVEDEISREDFLAQYASYLNPDALENYGLTAKEKTMIQNY
jgi:hypothetical protein